MNSISSLNTDAYINKFTNIVESTDLRVKIYLLYNTMHCKLITSQRIQQELEMSKIICEVIRDASNGHMLNAEYDDFCKDIDWWYDMAIDALETKKDYSYMLMAMRFTDLLRNKLLHLLVIMFHRVDPVYAQQFSDNIAQNIDPTHILSQSVINFLFSYL
ncbi:hypothetical protein EPVG_00282 [Emiliania huxleyi virus 201]|nr:hypothetical protein ELVG_00264 [Emiliania huxleyi virus 203]AEP15687.1 hypothetical protein EQVG_00277 [Emiliania huxleyi virus 207]AEP16281.1 hypothetical protein ERVG_00408 [Emiliania huxleyi virus 208]AET98169.1 hypothetical protein EPVG_00282 [Emiliania huxleyi virus 201]